MSKSVAKQKKLRGEPTMRILSGGREISLEQIETVYEVDVFDMTRQLDVNWPPIVQFIDSTVDVGVLRGAVRVYLTRCTVTTSKPNTFDNIFLENCVCDALQDVTAKYKLSIQNTDTHVDRCTTKNLFIYKSNVRITNCKTDVIGFLESNLNIDDTNVFKHVNANFGRINRSQAVEYARQLRSIDPTKIDQISWVPGKQDQILYDVLIYTPNVRLDYDHLREFEVYKRQKQVEALASADTKAKPAAGARKMQYDGDHAIGNRIAGMLFGAPEPRRGASRRIGSRMR
jgi:hypothetical protein